MPGLQHNRRAAGAGAVAHGPGAPRARQGGDPRDLPGAVPAKPSARVPGAAKRGTAKAPTGAVASGAAHQRAPVPAGRPPMRLLRASPTRAGSAGAAHPGSPGAAIEGWTRCVAERGDCMQLVQSPEGRPAGRGYRPVPAGSAVDSFTK